MVDGQAGAGEAVQVYVFGFEGVFSGPSEYEYRYPDAGGRLKCMLFLSTSNGAPSAEEVGREIAKYGFSEVMNVAGNKLWVERLNSIPGLQPYYEEALSSGSSLAIY